MVNNKCVSNEELANLICVATVLHHPLAFPVRLSADSLFFSAAC